MRKDTDKSSRGGSRYCSKSLFFDDSERSKMGAVNRRRERSYRQRQSANDWEYVDGSWKWEKSPITEVEAAISEDARRLVFGEYDEWANVEAIANKRGYAQDLLGETNAQCPEKKRFIERIRWKEEGIAMNVITGSAGWEVKNMPTAGEEF